MSLGADVEKFVGEKGREYYIREFDKIQRAKGIPLSWNTMAFLFGPLWASWRQMWGFFWAFCIGELTALILLARGLWAEPGGEMRLRYQQILGNITKRKEDLAQMIAEGDQAGAELSTQIITNLQRVAHQLEQQLGQEELLPWLVGGIFLLLTIKILEGLSANLFYQKKYLSWKLGKLETAQALNVSSSGAPNGKALILGVAFLILIWPLSIFSFTVLNPDQVLGIPLVRFPLEKELFFPLAQWGDSAFNWMALHFGDFFKGITAVISFMIQSLEVILIDTPWAVVMIFLVVIAWGLKGPRLSLFTAASLLYLALMGLWEASMMTMALIGVATLLCLLFGIPLGIWFGRHAKAYTFALPILDFMQTMPAFVYLIPIIAFFGTGKPPGVLATIVFAMPPVVRLTALGIRSVPSSLKEAATAFGCSSWQLLRYVEIPLAMPSIMTGINQTIMMGLSMVVVASLIGAGGLGTLILEALQYAAKGQGLLSGLAILLCAMMIDRMIQGAYRSRNRPRS